MPIPSSEKLAATPLADELQQHLLDEIKHPETHEAFECMLLTPRPAPEDEQPETD